MPGPRGRDGVKAKPKDAKGALRRIITYLMQYKYLVLLFIFCAFASNLGNLMGPNFAGKAIDAASKGVGKVVCPVCKGMRADLCKRCFGTGRKSR